MRGHEQQAVQRDREEGEVKARLVHGAVTYNCGERDGGTRESRREAPPMRQ
jgi:hypothetical protein